MERTRPEQIKLTLTAGERALIEEACTSLGLGLSQWVRSVVLPAARQVIAGGSQ